MLDVRKRLNVLLVNPRFPPSYWSFRLPVEMLGLDVTMPSTPLATVAAMLPREHFRILGIIDLNAQSLLDEQIQRADIVMLTAMIVQQDSLRKIIAKAKGFGKTVVVGGPFATTNSDLTLDMGPDHLVLGEAEMTLLPFVEDFLAGRAKRVYDEQSVRPRVKIPLSNEGKPLLIGTPVPDWSALRLDRCSSPTVQFSRGCPFNCDFCDIIVMFGHKTRTKTPAQMIAELEAIRRTGWRGSIFIVDDNFIGNRAAVREFLPVLTKWQEKHHYPFSFYTEASVDLGTETLRDIREGMIKAGFEEVFCGIESIDPKVLAAMDKGQNQGDLAEKVRVLQQAGFGVTAGLIIGNDGDRPEVFDELFRFIQDNGIVMAMAGLLTALRGTPLYERLKREGRLRGESEGNNTHQFQLNFQPKMDEKILIDGYVGLLERLYAPKNYYERCRILRARRGPYRRMSRLNRHGVLAATRIFYHYLVRRPDKEFVKFIAETLLTTPWDLPEAITQTIKFAHYQEITEAAATAHRYPERVATLAERFQEQVAALRGDAKKCLRQLAKLEQRFTAEATRLCHSIPRDFRANAQECLERWKTGEFAALVRHCRDNLMGTPTLVQ